MLRPEIILTSHLKPPVVSHLQMAKCHLWFWRPFTLNWSFPPRPDMEVSDDDTYSYDWNIYIYIFMFWRNLTILDTRIITNQHCHPQSYAAGTSETLWIRFYRSNILHFRETEWPNLSIYYPTSPSVLSGTQHPGSKRSKFCFAADVVDKIVPAVVRLELFQLKQDKITPSTPGNRTAPFCPFPSPGCLFPARSSLWRAAPGLQCQRTAGSSTNRR